MKELRLKLNGNGYGNGKYSCLITRKYQGTAPDIALYFRDEQEKDISIELDPRDALQLIEALDFMCKGVSELK